MDNQQKANQVKTAENALKESLAEHLIKPLNLRLNRLQLQASQRIVECLQNTKLDNSEAYKCKADVEKDWIDKQERVLFFAKKYNQKLSLCLAECKNIMTQPVHECYCDCLGNFKEFAEKLKYEQT